MPLELAGYRITSRTTDGRHRAIHRWTGRRVEIEVGVEDDTAAIVRAAAALDSIDHPGVARILGHGVLATGETWRAVELPEGIALADVMLRRRLAAGEIIALLRDAADVLAAAHRASVVHCALRPDAIYFGTGSHHPPVIVGAWGAMRAPGRSAGEDVDLSVYAAPELGRRFDGRADLYSLGVIAYRAFTGRFPEADVVHVAGAPEPLSRLLVRMLAADPERRPSAPEVRLLAGRMLEPDRVTAPRARTRWTPVSGIRAVHAAEEIVELKRKT